MRTYLPLEVFTSNWVDYIAQGYGIGIPWSQLRQVESIHLHCLLQNFNSSYENLKELKEKIVKLALSWISSVDLPRRRPMCWQLNHFS